LEATTASYVTNEKLMPNEKLEDQSSEKLEDHSNEKLFPGKTPIKHFSKESAQ